MRVRGSRGRLVGGPRSTERASQGGRKPREREDEEQRRDDSERRWVGSNCCYLMNAILEIRDHTMSSPVTRMKSSSFWKLNAG